MTGDQTARLIYLLVLALALGGSLLVAVRRGGLGPTLAQAAIWVLIFLGAVAAHGLWPDIRAALRPGQAAVATPEGPAVAVPRSANGHYYLTVHVNGVPVPVAVDTGATDFVLARQDAERAGLDPDALAYLGTALTANGPVRTARVVLDEVALEGITDRDVPAVVTDGALGGSLLGMSYLGRFARIEIADGRLLLTR